MFDLRALYARWNLDNDIERLNIGADEQLGWFLEPSLRFDNVVIKLDFQRQDNDTGNDVDGFNVGFGYSF